MTTRRARSGAGRQNAAYVEERRSTTSPRPARLADDRVEVASPVGGDAAEPGQADPAAQPVRRDPLAGTHHAVQRRDDRHPGQRPAVGGGVEGR